MKKITFGIFLFVLMSIWIGPPMQAQPELKTIMKVKLINTQAVLEGLALEDFSRIERAATTLASLSKASAWKVAKTPEYIKFSKDFQEVADSLAANAKARKLEASTLDYVQLTMLCVKCHTHARKIGVASLDDGKSSNSGILAAISANH